MSVKVICFWSTLFRLAREAALLRGTDEAEAAAARHEHYRQMCLDADEVRW